MWCVLDEGGTISALRRGVGQIESHPDVSGVLILACDANDYQPESLDPILKGVSPPVFGGIFPGICFNRRRLKKGTLIAGLSSPLDVQTIENLSDPKTDYDEVIDEKFPDTEATKTMFVLVDGFSQRISSLIDSLFNVFGLEFNYIGGGAGSLSMRQKPCLFTNSGLKHDCAVLAASGVQSGVGVRHGWKKLSGPYRVTESDRNIIKTLDWKPAFSMYKEVVQDQTHQALTRDNFFDISKGFPFGISKLEDEHIVRDPIMVGKKGSLVCVGEVPQEAFVSILCGDVDSLVGAAGTALELAKANYRSCSPYRTTLFIDCVSRVLFLGDGFEKELNAVYEEDVGLIGALTIGEVANSKKQFLEYYNKTSVVGVLED
jgi:hypothetical protein